ncbi:MAG: putative oxidase [Acidimicrobiales bacterium]|nr:putative oxidase [Acidimicrobiales bacterium]
MDLNAFAGEVGGAGAGPVTVVGGRTEWHVGGAPHPGTRQVVAPSGVVEHEPAELTVRVRAGTQIEELDAALARHGQCTVMPIRPGATVGGLLAVGHSSVKRLGHGPVRDTLLEARFVNANGRLVKAGGPVVKNVSGFDLCRVLVGSLGTLGFLAEVVLRCRPRPARSVWLAAEDADPLIVLRALYRPASILWDGRTTWVCLEGAPGDVVDQQRALSGIGAWRAVDGPPEPPPAWTRSSTRPSALVNLTGPFIAEIGVGVVHAPVVPPPAPVDESRLVVQQRLKTAFDPTGRLNPGRAVS